MDVSSYIRPLCKLCINRHFTSNFMYHLRKRHLDDDLLPSVVCNDCCGLNNFMCSECVVQLIARSRNMPLLDHVGDWVLDSRLIRDIVLADIRGWYSVQFYFNEVNYMVDSIPYCTNKYHIVANVAVFQRLVIERCQSTGRSLTVNSTSMDYWGWDVQAGLIGGDWEFEFYEGEYKEHYGIESWSEYCRDLYFYRIPFKL